MNLIRVERAILDDTDRLEREIQAFQDAVREEEYRSESWKRAWATVRGDSTIDDNIDNNDDETFDHILRQQEEAFRSEIQLLREAVTQQELEIAHLQQLRKDQVAVLRALDNFESALEEERNTLELEAQAFDWNQEQLYRSLVEVQAEVERLSSSRMRLTGVLFDLKVVLVRGLRYTLINELRLAYRPKGDIQWNEIQCAWSLAAQLLLSVATIFGFQSMNWKVAPLSQCA